MTYDVIMPFWGPWEELCCLSGVTRGRQRRKQPESQDKSMSGNGQHAELGEVGSQKAYFFLTPAHPPCLKLDS